MKKGFTIVELMAAIVILAIITLIGVSGYREISERTKTQAYSNKVKLIETKAEEYANSTGFLATNVDNLVQLGYLEADNEEGEVLDPRNGERMNCHVVNIAEETSNFYGEYTDQEECDNNNIETVNMHLGINIYKASDRSRVENNTWVGENVLLVPYFKDENINENEVKKITWSSNIGREEREVNHDFASQKEYRVEASQIINTSYSVNIEMEDGVKYQSKAIVKIDKQRPVIYSGEINVKGKNEYTAEEKEVSISASDGNGSGIYGYYIGVDNRCQVVSYEENESNVYKKQLDAGSYYVCVRDKVGNVAEDISTKVIVVDKVDKTAPSCVLQASGTMGNNGYYTSDVEISFKEAIDNESGVSHTLIDKAKITEDTNGIRVTGTVVDNVGNSANCYLDIKMDKTAPSCTLKASGPSGRNGWFIGDIGISFEQLQDNMSGVMSYAIERNVVSENTSGTIVNASVIDVAGNQNTCQIEVKKDSEAPRIEAINNPLNLNADPYEFRNNTRAVFGVSGGLIEYYGGASGMTFPVDKSIECSPSSSRATGSYPVTCVATGGNGLSSTTTFYVNHSYPAEYYSHTSLCTNPHNCYMPSWSTRSDKLCEYDCDDGVTRGDIPMSYRDDNSPSGWGGYGQYYTFRDEGFRCPNGGVLREQTCYFE